MAWVANELTVLAPDFTDVKNDDLRYLLVKSLDGSKGLVIEFARVAEVIATINASEAALALYRGFSGILNRYNVPLGYSGSFRTVDFDFYKFLLGHELFVTLFAFLIREGRWELIADLLEEEIYVENKRGGLPGTVLYDQVSQGVRLLDHRKQRLNLNRISLHADILNERHTNGELAEGCFHKGFYGG